MSRHGNVAVGMGPTSKTETSMMRWNGWGRVLAGLAAVAISAQAQAVGLPHTFVPGVPPAAFELNENFAYVAPPNVVHVNPDPSGPAASGAALHMAVDPVNLSTINGPPASDNPYLVVIAPGLYSLKDKSLVVPPHVHLLGSGKSATRLVSEADHAIMGEHHASLRSLTLEHKASGERNFTSVYLASSGAQLPFWIEGVDVRTDTDHEATGLFAGGGVKVLLRDASFHLSTEKSATGLHVEDEASVEAHDVESQVQADGFAQALFIDTKAWTRSFFGTSHLSAASPNFRYPIVTGEDFEGTLRIHASTISGHKIFARVDGKGRLLVGTSEMAGSFYEALGPTLVKCVHIFDHDFDDLLRCNSVP